MNILKLRLLLKKRSLIKKNKHIGFSQCGEDGILFCLFHGKNDGFYVDVGAHHPFRFSNTAAFYERGWHGINIEPLPEGYKMFNQFRPRDINLNIGIARQAGQLEYYAFNEPAYNTFKKEVVERLEGQSIAKVVRKQNISTYSLEKALSENMPRDKKIDFMNIDAEGMDFEVLESNDWKRWRPTVILVEGWNIESCSQVANNKITDFLEAQNYICFTKCLGTLF